MERTEPTFVPEWLKSSGSLTATSHQSSLQSDDQSASKSLRNKSFINSSDNELGRPTTSSYFRRPSSSNGSGNSRSYSSFGRNRDRDWDKSKEKSEPRHRDYSDPLASIFPSRFEKDGLRRSHSNLSAKRGESWSKKVVTEKNGHNNGKISFEKDFPSLGAEEKQVDSEIGRVPSPGLTSAIQSLPVGNSSVIGGDVWTSALAEVPVLVGTNGPVSVSSSTNVATGRNMAETLAQGPPRAHTVPQLSVETQRLEELAVKQSRQLIPMTPSMPKALALSSSDKPKVKVGQLQLQNSHVVNHSLSPRPVSVKTDVIKTSSSSLSSPIVGKLQVLKPSRERNGTIPAAKESSSPTGGSKLPKSPHAVPSVAPLRNTGAPVIEKRPSPQAKSRNDFFNLMRKKSMANNQSPVAPDTRSSDSTTDKPDEGGTKGGGVQQPSGENKVDMGCNGDTCVVTETPAVTTTTTTTNSNTINNGKKTGSSSDVILSSEEEEARFLKSLGWEETTEEGGLTEEEINSFYRDYVNLKTASNFFKGTQPKCLMPLNLQMGKNDISADTKVDS